MENASNEYFRNAVLTASREQLHLMLYDGAIRFTKQGISGIEEQNWEDAFNGFSRAQKIVLEMVNGLDYSIDRPLCERLAGLYNFIYRKLVDASINRDTAIAREALGLIEYQRETWLLLMQKLAEEQKAATASVPTEADLAQVGAVHGSFSAEG